MSNKNRNNNHNKKSHDKYKNNNKNAGHYNKNKRIINNNNTNNNNNNNNNSSNSNNNNCKSTKIKAVTSSYKIYNVKVGESEFCLTAESLKRDEPNFFTAAFFGYFSEANNTRIFIERDPIYFSMIVRYLRGYKVDWPIDKISMSNLLDDVKFYGFERLQHLLEEIYEKNHPEDPIPWKILTYAPEDSPVAAINIRDVERERWDARSLIYNVNQISKKTSSENDGDTVAQENDENNENVEDVENNENNENDENNNVNDNNATDNAAENITTTENDNATNTDDVIIEPNPEKGLYRLEIHGKNAMATVISNHNNGIKFENFTLKNSEEEETFRILTESFRTPEGSLTLSPSLKLPFLKDSCIEIDGSKYYSHKDLSGYFGVTDKVKLYFEEIVIRIVDAPFLMRARALTIPHYYASQPTIQPAQS